MSIITQQIEWANKHLQADEYIDDWLLTVLMAEGRLYATSCFDPAGVEFNGCIVAPKGATPEDLQAICNARPFGESIAGVIHSIIDEQDQTLADPNEN